jgi:hypothetical protein
MSNGPNIKRDGLVFYYDVNNTKSYVGEPTTNLVNPSWSAWGIDASGYSTAGTRTIISPYHCRIDDIASNTRQSITMGGVNENSIYTFSVKYRKIGGAPSLRFQIYSRVGGSYVQQEFPTTIQLGIIDTYEWQTATYNYTTPPGTDLFFWYMQDGNDYTPYTHSFELKEPQVEKKSHATTFVNGARSVTQSLLDMTRRTTIDLTLSSFDVNSYPVLDGTDDRIDLGNLSEYFPSGVPAVTVEQVFKITSGASGPLAPLFENYRFNLWYDYSTDTFSLNTRSGPPDTSGYQFAVGGSSTITCNPKGNYNHIVGVYETINTTQGRVRLYVNGEFAGQYVDTKMGAYPIYPTWIGQSNHSGYGTYKLNGRVDLTKLYTLTLTANDVKQNYNALKHRFGL